MRHYTLYTAQNTLHTETQTYRLIKDSTTIAGADEAFRIAYFRDYKFLQDFPTWERFQASAFSSLHVPTLLHLLRGRIFIYLEGFRTHCGIFQILTAICFWYLHKIGFWCFMAAKLCNVLIPVFRNDIFSLYLRIQIRCLLCLLVRQKLKLFAAKMLIIRVCLWLFWSYFVFSSLSTETRDDLTFIIQWNKWNFKIFSFVFISTEWIVIF